MSPSAPAAIFRIDRAARHLSGIHFGTLDRTALRSARTYQLQTGQNELVYKSYEQMKNALAAEARVLGDDPASLRAAIFAQINALNAKAELQRPYKSIFPPMKNPDR